MNGACARSECTRSAHARGLCARHYQQFRRGSAFTPSPSRNNAPADERFWVKVEENPAGCWLWQASTRNGYGCFAVEPGDNAYAHRWAYEQMVGEIPAGLQLDHLCETRNCVNPYHLDPVTPLVNTRRSSRGNATKTHCPAGHEYNEANTKLYRGRRYCVVCQAAYRIEYRALRKRQREATWASVGVA